MKKNKICIMILTGIYIFFISIFNVKALTIQNAVGYRNGASYSLSGGNGSYADIAIKYYGGNQIDSVEKLSFYIEPNSTESQYKYVSGFIRFEFANPSGTYVPDAPIVSLAGNTCELEHSIGTGPSYVAFTCPMTGGWIDFLNLPESLTSFYIQRNLGVSDLVQNNATLNQIQTNTNDIKNAMEEDVDNNYKQTPNQNDYNNYHQKENDIIGQISNTDTSAINIQNNNNANLFIWDTLTRSLQSHAKVMALMISILSIGIIKLILNR